MSGVSVLGLACRFPGAANVDEFWKLILEKRSSITEVPSERWNIDVYYDPDPSKPGRMATRFGGFLPNVDQFDASFFGLSVREANFLDPQQRILLELAWQAFEDAGLDITQWREKSVGVFLGASHSDYGLLLHASSNAPDAYAGTGCALSLLANRISYRFDFRGPSLVIDTACASGLSALHLARTSLETGECDLALVGAINLILDPTITLSFSRGGFMSPTGQCRPFDDGANGYVRSEGAAMVILGRREFGQGARPYAELLGTAANHDGLTNGLTAPSRSAQARVITRALETAGVAPKDIALVEAHGTGTPLGDPIEANALGDVFARDRESPLRIGSAKGNIGHTEAAAGLAGFIKGVLAVHHRILPPSAQFERGNKRIPFERLKLAVQENTEHLDRDFLCGVSSFGFGGANTHAIIGPAPSKVAARETAVFCISAHTPEALIQRGRNLARAPLFRDDSVESICLRSQTCPSMEYRATFRIGSKADLVTTLENLSANLSGVRSAEDPTSDLLCVFSGGTTDWPGDASELLRYPVFASAIARGMKVVEECADTKLPEWGTQAFRAEVIPSDPLFCRASLVVYQLAWFELLRSFGVQPSAFLGHSVGEYSALAAAGFLTSEDAIKLVVARGQALAAAPKGVMYAVRLNPADALQLLPEAFLSAENEDGGSVVAVAEVNAEGLESKCKDAKVRFVRLGSNYPFHSPLLKECAKSFAESLPKFSIGTPTARVVSTVTGNLLEPTELTADYFARQLVSPVRFRDAINVASPRGLILEIGPKTELAGILRRRFSSSNVAIVSATSIRSEESLCWNLSALWARGYKVTRLPAGVSHRKGCSPEYPWARRRHWFNASMENLGASVDNLAADSSAAGDADPTAETGEPLEHVESRIVEIWTAVVGAAPSSRDQSLYEAGGDSVLGARIVSGTLEAFSVQIDLESLFSQFSVRRLATLVTDALVAELSALTDEEAAALLQGSGPNETNEKGPVS
ncbi:MAG: type I polyketide synthase [Polyangiaceae bacterium]|nr:type I polyketide synthase [Polyangiaceae bacterium]